MKLHQMAGSIALISSLLLLTACKDEPLAEPARPALVVQPGAGIASASVYSGEVRALEEPQLSFRISGKIAKRFVDVGTPVKAGQALAQLDSSDVNLQAQSSQAALASAQSDLALAKSELERYKALVDKQVVSRSLYETRLSAYQAAAARVKQARAAANVSANQETYAVLRAPKNGVIAQRLAEAGQVVGAGQTVFVLATDGEREISISVSEQFVSQFQPGRKMQVELWAAPGKIFPATLREISPSADPLARTFAAKVSFRAEGVKAEVGQSARVYVQDENDSKMSLPLSAIYQLNGKPAVWVLQKLSPSKDKTFSDEEKKDFDAKAKREQQVHLVPVQIGPYGENSVPVLSGVSETDWVVIAGVHLLREGQTVRAVDNNNREVAAAFNAIAANKNTAN
ncbi:MAG TPA: efflux RND transporter periplasmic adaptor subunit [Arenimonas sp.]|jgi:multidrug efflux system membrane fusion protein|nr:efflux RND transporter periplasmic adaptor subunit [Arenimonas sp.]